MTARTASMPEAGQTDLAWRLVRWPPQSMLPSATHARLATLMISAPYSAQALASRARADVSLCIQFIQALRLQGLVTPSAPGTQAQPLTAPAVASAVQTDAWGLAVETTAPQGSPVVRSATAAPAPVADSGLFARIRRRLGLGSVS